MPKVSCTHPRVSSLGLQSLTKSPKVVFHLQYDLDRKAYSGLLILAAKVGRALVHLALTQMTEVIRDWVSAAAPRDGTWLEVDRQARRSETLNRIDWVKAVWIHISCVTFHWNVGAVCWSEELRYAMVMREEDSLKGLLYYVLHCLALAFTTRRRRRSKMGCDNESDFWIVWILKAIRNGYNVIVWIGAQFHG